MGAIANWAFGLLRGRLACALGGFLFPDHPGPLGGCYESPAVSPEGHAFQGDFFEEFAESRILAVDT